MNDNTKKLIKIILQIVLSITFIISAYSKLITPGSVEVILIDQGIVNNRETAAYIIRVFISIELALGILFLFNNFLRKFTIPLSWLLLVGFTGYLIYSGIILGDKENCGCFGEMIKMSPFESIIKNIVLLVITIFLYKFSTIEKKKTVVPVSIIIISFAAVFILSPIRKIEDFQFSKFIYFEGKGRVDLTEGEKLLAVFSLDCEHCQQTAGDLARLKNQFKEIPEVFALFFSEDGISVDSFKVLTKSNFPFHKIDVDEYFQLIGNQPPRIYFLNEGKIEKYWDEQFVKNIVLEFKQ